MSVYSVLSMNLPSFPLDPCFSILNIHWEAVPQVDLCSPVQLSPTLRPKLHSVKDTWIKDTTAPRCSLVFLFLP